MRCRLVLAVCLGCFCMVMHTASSAQESGPDPEEEQAAAPSGDRSGNTAQPQEGVLIRGADSQTEQRLDQIRERKIQMKAEREALLREREELQKEIHKAEADFPQKISRSLENTALTTYESLKQKLAALDARTEKFSSELKALNEEEQGLLEGLKRP